jgi:hypothetical protein
MAIDPAADTWDGPPRPGGPEAVVSEAALAAEYRAVAVALDRGSAEDLRAFIEAGRLGLRLLDHAAARPRLGTRKGETPPPRLAAYGDAGAVDRAARAVGLTPTALHEIIGVVRMFTEEGLTTFLERRNARGQKITPDHLCVIARASTWWEREQLVAFFYRHSPSVSGLRAKRTRLARKLRRPVSTAPPRLKTLSGAVARFEVLARNLLAQLEGDMQPALFGPLHAITAGECMAGPDELALLRRMPGPLKALQVALGAASELISRAEAALAGRPGASGPAAKDSPPRAPS